MGRPTLLHLAYGTFAIDHAPKLGGNTTAPSRAFAAWMDGEHHASGRALRRVCGDRRDHLRHVVRTSVLTSSALERRHLDAAIFQRLAQAARDLDGAWRVAVNADCVRPRLDHLARHRD